MVSKAFATLDRKGFFCYSGSMIEENEALISRLMIASGISRKAAIEHCVSIARLDLGMMGVKIRLHEQVDPELEAGQVGPAETSAQAET